ncbi:hypothetical protein [Arthrobacter crystallopoietes]|uniref:Uncharacterized protein n=1 Tax=Crystallibacter crystallopoietes TaxID=37928 RepID=A0A1H1FT69_9MICC|nr:hypothetical protein [Arthrobacter crystallopoietes]SDR04065.1 hypothetical protein SAMN04489742_3635 [Arthrobacter crystallopoietes]
MAENWNKRFGGDPDEKSKNIQDWMYGAGGKVLGAILVVLGLYFVLRIFL